MTANPPVDRSSLRSIGWMILVLVIALSVPVTRLALHVRRCRLVEAWTGSQLETTPVGPQWMSDLIGQRATFLLGRPVSLFLPIMHQFHDPQEISRILDTVAEFETLKEVYLNGLTDDQLLQLRSLKGLTKLQLSFSHVTVKGLSVLDSLPDLRVLELGSSESVDDRALVSISRSTELEELDLGGTGVTDAGLPQLTSLRKLRVLNLVDTAIHDEGLMALAGLRSLERLDVSATSVTDEGLSALRAALPNLEILDD